MKPELEALLNDDLRHIVAGPHAACDLDLDAIERRGHQLRRQRHVRALSVAVAGVTAAAVGVTVAVTGAGSPAPDGAHHARAAGGAHRATALPAIRLTAAQQVLYRLSAAAAAAAPAPGGQYVELTEVRRGPASVDPRSNAPFASKMLKKRLPPKVRAFFEQELKQAGRPQPSITIRRTSVIDSRTGDTWTYQQGPGVPAELPVSRHDSPTRAQFAAWPTDPPALRGLLVRQAQQLTAARETVPGDSMDALVFQQATNWLWNPLLSPALRAALYKVLAGTPGVVARTGVRDSAGRPAIEISRLDTKTRQDSATFEAPATGAVLESWFSDAGSDVYLSITGQATLPPDPYVG